MSNLISIRMEVRGHQSAVEKFCEINWQAEANGQGHGYLIGIPFADWQRWDEYLEFEEIGGIPSYYWFSKRPDLFVVEMAKRWPELTFVVSMWEEGDCRIGSAVLRGEEKWVSFEKELDLRIPEVLSEDDDYDAVHREAARIRQEICYEHYCKVKLEAGLEPWGR